MDNDPQLTNEDLNPEETSKEPTEEAFEENGKKHKCNQCPKRFATKTSLWRHEKSIHQGIADYKCSHCNQAFYQSQSKKQHEESVHVEGKQTFDCESCGFAYGSKAGLNKHNMKTH